MSEPVVLPALPPASNATRSATSSGRVNLPVAAAAACCFATSAASPLPAFATVAGAGRGAVDPERPLPVGVGQGEEAVEAGSDGADVVDQDIHAAVDRDGFRD